MCKGSGLLGLALEGTVSGEGTDSPSTLASGWALCVLTEGRKKERCPQLFPFFMEPPSGPWMVVGVPLAGPAWRSGGQWGWATLAVSSGLRSPCLPDHTHGPLSSLPRQFPQL